MAARNIRSMTDGVIIWFKDTGGTKWITSDLEEHSWSLLHHKKLDKENGRDFTHKCSLCNEDFSGLLAYTKHIHSDKHLKKLHQWKEKNAPANEVQTFREENGFHTPQRSIYDNRPRFSWSKQQQMSNGRPRFHQKFGEQRFDFVPWRPRAPFPRHRMTWMAPLMPPRRNEAAPRYYGPRSSPPNSLFTPQNRLPYNENILENRSSIRSPNVSENSSFFEGRNKEQSRNSSNFPGSPDEFSTHQSFHEIIGYEGNGYTDFNKKFKGFEATRLMRQKMEKLRQRNSRQSNLSNKQSTAPSNGQLQRDSLSKVGIDERSNIGDLNIECSGSFQIISSKNVDGAISNARIKEKEDNNHNKEGKIDVKSPESGAATDCPFVGSNEEETLASYVAESLGCLKASSTINSTYYDQSTVDVVEVCDSDRGNISTTTDDKIVDCETSVEKGSHQPDINDAVLAKNAIKRMPEAVRKPFSGTQGAIKVQGQLQLAKNIVEGHEHTPRIYILEKNGISEKRLTNAAATHARKQANATHQQLRVSNAREESLRKKTFSGGLEQAKSSMVKEPVLSSVSDGNCNNGKATETSSREKQMSPHNSTVLIVDADGYKFAEESNSSKEVTGENKDSSAANKEGELSESSVSLEPSIVSLDESLKEANTSKQCEFRYQDGRRCPTSAVHKFCAYHEKVVRDVFIHYTKVTAQQKSNAESGESPVSELSTSEQAFSGESSSKTSLKSKSVAVTVSENSTTSSLSGVETHQAENEEHSSPLVEIISDAEGDGDHLSLHSRFKYLHKATKNPLSGLELSRANLPPRVRKLLSKKFGSERKGDEDSATVKGGNEKQVADCNKVKSAIESEQAVNIDSQREGLVTNQCRINPTAEALDCSVSADCVTTSNVISFGKFTGVTDSLCKFSICNTTSAVSSCDPLKIHHIKCPQSSPISFSNKSDSRPLLLSAKQNSIEKTEQINSHPSNTNSDICVSSEVGASLTKQFSKEKNGTVEVSQSITVVSTYSNLAVSDNFVSEGNVSIRHDHSIVSEKDLGIDSLYSLKPLPETIVFSVSIPKNEEAKGLPNQAAIQFQPEKKNKLSRVSRLSPTSQLKKVPIVNTGVQTSLVNTITNVLSHPPLSSSGSSEKKGESFKKVELVKTNNGKGVFKECGSGRILEVSISDPRKPEKVSGSITDESSKIQETTLLATGAKKPLRIQSKQRNLLRSFFNNLQKRKDGDKKTEENILRGRSYADDITEDDSSNNRNQVGKDSHLSNSDILPDFTDVRTISSSKQCGSEVSKGFSNDAKAVSNPAVKTVAHASQDIEENTSRSEKNIRSPVIMEEGDLDSMWPDMKGQEASRHKKDDKTVRKCKRTKTEKEQALQIEKYFKVNKERLKIQKALSVTRNRVKTLTQEMESLKKVLSMLAVREKMLDAKLGTVSCQKETCEKLLKRAGVDIEALQEDRDILVTNKRERDRNMNIVLATKCIQPKERDRERQSCSSAALLGENNESSETSGDLNVFSPLRKDVDRAKTRVVSLDSSRGPRETEIECDQKDTSTLTKYKHVDQCEQISNKNVTGTEDKTQPENASTRHNPNKKTLVKSAFKPGRKVTLEENRNPHLSRLQREELRERHTNTPTSNGSSNRYQAFKPYVSVIDNIKLNLTGKNDDSSAPNMSIQPKSMQREPSTGLESLDMTSRSGIDARFGNNDGCKDSKSLSNQQKECRTDICLSETEKNLKCHNVLQSRKRKRSLNKHDIAEVYPEKIKKKENIVIIETPSSSEPKDDSSLTESKLKISPPCENLDLSVMKKSLKNARLNSIDGRKRATVSPSYYASIGQAGQDAKVFTRHSSAVTDLKLCKGFLYSSGHSVKMHDTKSALCLSSRIDTRKEINCLEQLPRCDSEICVFDDVNRNYGELEISLFKVATIDFNDVHSCGAKSPEAHPVLHQWIHQIKYGRSVVALHTAFDKLFVGLSNGVICRINLQTLRQEDETECLKTGPVNQIKSATNTFTTKEMLIALIRYEICLFNTQDKLSLLKRFKEELPGKISCIEVFNQKIYAGNSQGIVHMYKTEDICNREVFCQQSKSKAITAIKADGDLLVTASADLLIRCYDISNGNLMVVFGGHKNKIQVLELEMGVQSTVYSGCLSGEIRSNNVIQGILHRCQWESCTLPFCFSSQLKEHILSEHLRS
eukprot:gene13226-4046_t